MQRGILALLSLAGLLLGQPATGPAPAPHGEAKATPAPVHTVSMQLPPMAVLRHLRAGNARFRLAVAQQKEVPPPQERPSGAGRYLAAVVVCADAGVDAASLLGVWPKDVLVLATAGGRLGADEIAVLERAVQQDRLSLCVLLAHADCPCLLPAGKDATPAQQALARKAAASHALARSRNLPLPQAHALLQLEGVLASSDLLQAAVAADTFRVIAATVDAKSGNIVWHGHRADEIEPSPIR